MVTDSFCGEVQRSDRACYFSHFDPAGVVDPYVLRYLDALLKIGFSIVFISTCHSLQKSSLEQLLSRCHKVVLRKNLGFDFGSWCLGLKESPIQNEGCVLFANDSVFGPLFDLEEVMVRWNESGADIFGITDSFEIEHHIQSYFLLCGAHFCRSEAFRNFWRSFLFTTDKLQIIYQYEIGFSAIARNAGFKLGAYCSYEELYRKAENGEDLEMLPSELSRIFKMKNVNPTHFFWKPLLRQLSCPFIKRDLLAKNPVQIAGIGAWHAVIGDISPYPVEVIKKYLEREALRSET